MINEPIIAARFKKFRESFGLNSLPENEAFERYVNSSILSTHQPEAFSADSDLLEKICTGGAADTGIDGIGVKVNGVLIKSEVEVKEIIGRSRKASIEFIFIQSKNKSNFDAGELNTFLSGVRNFLSNDPVLPTNEKIKEWLKIKDYLLDDEVVFLWEANPTVRLYYVAMGKWRNNEHHLAVADVGKGDILKLQTYKSVDLYFVDSDYFIDIIDSNENRFTEIIDTIGTMELTPVEGVKNSSIILCAASELSKLLTTPEGVIRKSLFDDNVRDFHGMNTVNSEILNTIEHEPARFILLNNGITIVCDDFTSNNRKVKISNPQIVNGCQTCHVIFAAQSKGYDLSSVPVSIRIIATNDDEISNSIVRGTNRQNIVYEEAFEATKPFHKQLESFISSYVAEFPDKVYYERRSKQYAHNPTINQIQKINIRILTQYFVSMFLNKPHVAYRHESFIIKEFQDRIFLENQSCLPYFTAAYSFYQLEKLFRTGNFHPELRAYKAHLLTVFRELAGGKCPNINNEKQIDAYCKSILDILKDANKTRELFKKSISIFNLTLDIWITRLGKSRFGIKDIEEFTKLLISNIGDSARSDIDIQEEDSDSDVYHKGIVKSIMVDKHGNPFGIIRRHPDNIPFFWSQNQDLKFYLLDGKWVMYQLRLNSNSNKLIAVNVKVAN